jgi:citrate/tricarballylate utilization protein
MLSRDPDGAALTEKWKQALRICNACRYCEGYCAVFPAVERRFTFSGHDLYYLANLCHECGECYYACQYSPPHEFDLNLPKTLAAARRSSYEAYAWPAFAGVLYRKTDAALALSAGLIPALFVAITFFLSGPEAMFGAHSVAEGSFYSVIPHEVMVWSFGAAGLFVAAALAAGFARFWKQSGERWSTLCNGRVLVRACREALSLRYLEGAGEGCAYPGDLPSNARRWFHHFTFYGFLLTFAATTVAAIYHNLLGRPAPYPFFSLPVMLGTAGGVGLLIGPAGLLWLKSRRNRELIDEGQSALDVTFLALLLLISVTGLLLLALRETAVMGMLLALHLGFVLGLFVTMPYGKFVHGMYRFGALAKNAAEEARSRE